MTTGNPNFDEQAPKLNAQGQEALEDLQVTLATYNIPEAERQEYINELTSKISGLTDTESIENVLGPIMLRAIKRSKELKSQTPEVKDAGLEQGMVKLDDTMTEEIAVPKKPEDKIKNESLVRAARNNVLESYGGESVPIIEGEIVEEIPQKRNESSLEMKIIKQGPMMSVKKTIPSGEHWIIPTAMSSQIVVSPGAKITIEGALMSSKIQVMKGGEVEVKGANMSSQIIKE